MRLAAVDRSTNVSPGPIPSVPGAGAAASGGSPPALDEPVTVSRQADEAFSRKDYQGAADPYAQLLRLAPEDVDTHSHLGLTLRCLGRSD